MFDQDQHLHEINVQNNLYPLIKKIIESDKKKHLP